MKMRSRKVTCRTYLWVYECKQIYRDLQQLNNDVKLMWIPSHMGISGNKVADGLARQTIESGTLHGQMTVANDHRILARQAMVKHSDDMFGGQEILTDLLIQSDLWSRSNHSLMDRLRRGAL
jgi:hypothetical protein